MSYTEQVKNLLYKEYDYNLLVIEHCTRIMNGDTKFTKEVKKPITNPDKFGDAELIVSQYEEHYIATRYFDMKTIKDYRIKNNIIIYLRNLYNKKYGEFQEDEHINEEFINEVLMDSDILEKLDTFNEVIRLC